MRTMKFDLMKPTNIGKRFVATIKYPRNPLFKFDVKGFYDWICEKRPSLKGQKIAYEFDDGVILYFNMSDREIMKYE